IVGTASLGVLIGSALQPVFPPPIECRTYHNPAGAWIDMVAEEHQPSNMLLWTTGLSHAEPLNRCTGNQCPLITGIAADTVEVAINSPAVNSVLASDPEGDPIVYTLLSGKGELDTLTGEWTFTPRCLDYPGLDVTIGASDRISGLCQTITFHVSVGPSQTLGAAVSDLLVPCGETATQVVIATQGCVPYSYKFLSGPGTFDTLSKVYAYPTSCADKDTHRVEIRITDKFGAESPCTFAVAGVCSCGCHGDPQCDGAHNVLDVVTTVNAAFGGAAAIYDSGCAVARTDVNCDGFNNVLDVVKSVNVAFRGADPALEFCGPCDM
ncbi:MAG TPA: hypothetical protein VLB27_12435, partial [candidate division Zixibacteria bacterium]|nr:hypothetical protein [candidate division Zixibacteria bacterium]